MADTVAVAILCKTPAAGRSKTRLSPPLAPEECAAASAAFIADLAETIASLAAEDPRVVPVAVYTPAGTEEALAQILPPSFALVPQRDGDFGARLAGGIEDLLDLGHSGAILVNADSPTLPAAILSAAVDGVLAGDGAVLSPADDGGYVLIGLSRPEPALFEDVAWSTPSVFRTTLERAAAAGVTVRPIASWYDIDDAASFAMLEAELAGTPPHFAKPDVTPSPARNTRRFVARRRVAVG